MSFYCITRDSSDGEENEEWRAHGPYETAEEAHAFDDAIEFCCPFDVTSLGAFESPDGDAAIVMAKDLAADANA